MDKLNNRDITHEWEELLKDAFGSTETPIAIDTNAEPVKEDPTVTPSAPEVPAKRPLYRRFWFWLVLISLAALLGIAAWLSLGKETDTGPTTPLNEYTQEALDQCKTGLAQWQAMESYYMTQNNLYYGDTLGGATLSEFWVSGDDIMKIVHFESMGYIAGALIHDGVTYSAESNIPSTTGIPEKNYWSLPDENALIAPPTLPWPMSFDWDASEIVNIIGTGNASANADHSHFTSVSFSVLRSDSVYAYMYPWHANFTFDVYGNLESVTIVDVTPGEAERTSICVITYRLGSTDYDIAQYIADAPSKPLIPIISTRPVPLPER